MSSKEDNKPGSVSIEKASSCVYPRQETTMSDWEHLTLSGGVELERIVSWLSKRFSKFKLSPQIVETNLEEALQAIEFYQSLSLDEASKFFYQKPQRPPQVQLLAPHALSHGEVADIVFESEFTPYYKPFCQEFESYPENRIGRARWWRHPPGESRATLFALHGWFMGDQRVNAITLVPGFFYRLGLDVILYELPYHGRRAPQGTSELLFPSAHVPRTNEGIAQTIYDLRALRMWVEEEYQTPAVGVVGMSLGGYLAALWSSLDELAFSIPLVPLVSMEELAWKLVQEYTIEPDEKLREAFLGCVTFQHLKNAYAIHSPLNFVPKTSFERRMIVAGLEDSFIPMNQPHSLWEHWGKPKIHWYQGGHVAQMAYGNAFEDVHQFLQTLELAHPQLLDIQTNNK